MAVIYLPPLQYVFQTEALSALGKSLNNRITYIREREREWFPSIYQFWGSWIIGIEEEFSY